MEQPVATLIAALLGFTGGLIVARFTYQQKSDELFFKALDFLGGGSQTRNLGIAAIELYWPSKRHRRASVSLLIGSAIYLLLASKQGDAAHEIHNLERIMSRLILHESYSLEFTSQYRSLMDAIKSAQTSGRTGGIIIGASQLSEWETKIKALIDRK